MCQCCYDEHDGALNGAVLQSDTLGLSEKIQVDAAGLLKGNTFLYHIFNHFHILCVTLRLGRNSIVFAAQFQGRKIDVIF